MGVVDPTRPPSQVAGQHPSTHILVKTEDSRAAGPTLAALFTPSSHVGVNTRRHGGFVSLVRGRSHIEILSESCFHFNFSLSYLLSIWSLSGVVLGKGAPPSVMALLCFLSHSFLLGLSPQPYPICLLSSRTLWKSLSHRWCLSSSLHCCRAALP